MFLIVQKSTKIFFLILHTMKFQSCKIQMGRGSNWCVLYNRNDEVPQKVCMKDNYRGLGEINFQCVQGNPLDF